MKTILYRRPWTYAAQRDAIFCDERYSITWASTKAGKTVGAIIWLVEQAVQGSAGHNYWWVAPLYSQSRIAYRRLKRFLPAGTYRHNDSELTIALLNGAVITFKTARDPDALYGEDVHAVVLDEASRMTEDAWHAVRSTLTATRGRARFIGNVKGTSNWLWLLAQRVLNEQRPGWKVSTITAYDAAAGGVLALEEVEDAKATLPSHIFDELYLAIPSETTRFFSGTPRFIDATAVPKGARVVRAWDFAVTEPKPGKDPDWTVGVKVAQHQGTTYIVDVVRTRATADEIVRLFTSTAKADGCDQVVEEERGAAGKMLVASLKSALAKQGIPCAVRAAALTGDKETRAFGLAAEWNKGDVVVVDAPWTADFLDEFERFPVGNRGHDDQVDAATHAFNDLFQRTYPTGDAYLPGISEYMEAL